MLESLLENNPASNKKAAKSIRKNMDFLSNNEDSNPIKTGFKYKKGEHWTQKPENKAKLRKMVKKSAATRDKGKNLVKE